MGAVSAPSHHYWCGAARGLRVFSHLAGKPGKGFRIVGVGVMRGIAEVGRELTQPVAGGEGGANVHALVGQALQPTTQATPKGVSPRSGNNKK